MLAAYPLARPGTGDLAAGVELVLDLADDLLEHVLQGDDPDRLVVLVDDQGSARRRKGFCSSPIRGNITRLESGCGR
jgi:hypothetical protein